MGRMYCGACGRVGCDDDDCTPEFYCKCECGGNIEECYSGQTMVLECDTCDFELEIE